MAIIAIAHASCKSRYLWILKANMSTSTLTSKKSSDSASKLVQLRDHVRILKERVSNLEAVEGKVESLEAIVEDLQLQVKKHDSICRLQPPCVFFMLTPSCDKL